MSRPILALALAALAGCGAPDVQPLSEAKRPEPEHTAPKDKEAKKPAPAPVPAPATDPAPAAAEPYKRPGDQRTQTDELTFWGWSTDGQRFAFELHDRGPGARACEGSVTLYVVDAARDAFADGAPLVVKHKEPGDDNCDPPDLGAEMAKQRPALLDRHGIVTGNLRPPLTPTRQPGGPKDAPSWLVPLTPDAPVRAELTNLHGGRDKAGEPGGAYKLSLTHGDRPPLVLEPGTRRRPFVWDYSLDGGLVFVAPTGTHAAVLVAMQQLSFEGDRHTFMSNGFALPTDWAPAKQP